MIKIGDSVKWISSRKPLGVVVHIFTHKGDQYAVLENEHGALKIVRMYEALILA